MLRRPQRAARAARAGDGEPRRHRQADARRARSRPRPTEPGSLLPNISAQVAAIELVTGAREVRRADAAERPRRAARGARVGLGALGAISRRHAADGARVQPPPRRPGPRARGGARGLRRRRRATTTTTSSSCSPTRATPAPCAATAPTRTAEAARRGLAPVSEWILGYYLADGLFRLTRRFNGLIPRINRARRAAGVRGRVRRAELPGVLQRAPLPLHRDGVRAAAASTARRRLRGCSTGSSASATRSPSRSSAVWWPPTTRC